MIITAFVSVPGVIIIHFEVVSSMYGYTIQKCPSCNTDMRQLLRQARARHVLHHIDHTSHSGRQERDVVLGIFSYF